MDLADGGEDPGDGLLVVVPDAQNLGPRPLGVEDPASHRRRDARFSGLLRLRVDDGLEAGPPVDRGQGVVEERPLVRGED